MPHHVFVAEKTSLLNPTRFDTEQLLGHRQVTDTYLLGLAVENDLRLVTFDAAVSMRVVEGAGPGHLVVL